MNVLALNRALDILAAILLIVVASPLFLLLAAVACWDGGPVFFHQTRVGLDSRAFRRSSSGPWS